MYCQCSTGYLEFSEYVFYLISYRCRTKLKLAEQKRGLFEDCMLTNRSLIVFGFALTAHIGLLLLFQVQTCPHTHKKFFINFPSKFAGSLSFKDRESLIGKKLTSIFSAFSNCTC